MGGEAVVNPAGEPIWSSNSNRVRRPTMSDQESGRGGMTASLASGAGLDRKEVDG